MRIFFLVIFLLGGCTSTHDYKPKRTNLIRPDLLIEFFQDETTVSNIKPIAEAVFSLLENENSLILLATSADNDLHANPYIAQQRIAYLSEALKESGVPDYKIKKIIRWEGSTDNIEVYALKDGWQGLPFDMLHYGFVPRTESTSVVIKTTPFDYQEPEPDSYLESFLVKRGDLERVIKELVEQVGWDDYAIHLKDKVVLEHSYILELKKLLLPLTEGELESILLHILNKEKLSNIKINLHNVEGNKTIVLSERVL